MRLLACLLAVAALAADEITLDDGTVLDGTITAETGDSVTIQVGRAGMSAMRDLPRARIAAITRGPSVRERALSALEAEAVALGTGGDAASWTALAQRAKAAGERLQARRWAAAAVERDRQDEAARGILDQRRVNGVWMNAHEAAVAAGLVWHEGRWLTHDERLAAEAAAAERVAASRRHGEALTAARAANASPGDEAPWPTTIVAPSTGIYGYTWWPRQPLYGDYGGGSFTRAGWVDQGGSTGVIRAAGRGSNHAWSVSWSW